MGCLTNSSRVDSVVNPTGRLMFNDFVRNMEDLATGLGASLEDGGLGLQGWDAGVEVDRVGAKGGKEIVGILSENSSVSLHHGSTLVFPFVFVRSKLIYLRLFSVGIYHASSCLLASYSSLCSHFVIQHPLRAKARFQTVKSDAAFR